MREPRRLLKRALDKFHLIDKGETALVGVSGGTDSLALLRLLRFHDERYRRNWNLIPVHVDPGFPGWPAERVARACARAGLECRVIRLDVPSRLAAINNDHCFFCARERRKALFRFAAEVGARKVALAHHLDDVNETYLMNLMFNSTSAAILPRQELFGGEVAVVRPLYYITKPQLVTYLRRERARPVRNSCPFHRAGKRMQVRRFLERLYRSDHRIRTNIFWGIHNLKPQYLPRAVATRRPAAGS